MIDNTNASNQLNSDLESYTGGVDLIRGPPQRRGKGDIWPP
jgi:hypothetical protein